SAHKAGAKDSESQVPARHGQNVWGIATHTPAPLHQSNCPIAHALRASQTEFNKQVGCSDGYTEFNKQVGSSDGYQSTAGSGICPPLPALIGVDEFQPVIPQRDALQQRPPPLHRPCSECDKVVLPIEIFAANGEKSLN
ncbi:MAG: hypothetical protein ACP5M4_15365, partial [Acidobacteriaceae bacterium]